MHHVCRHESMRCIVLYVCKNMNISIAKCNSTLPHLDTTFYLFGSSPCPCPCPLPFGRHKDDLCRSLVNHLEDDLWYLPTQTIATIKEGRKVMVMNCALLRWFMICLYFKYTLRFACLSMYYVSTCTYDIMIWKCTYVHEYIYIYTINLCLFAYLHLRVN